MCLIAGTPTSTVSMLPVSGSVGTSGMRMVMVSSANTTTAIGKPITITMPGTGQGGLPKTVKITGKPGSSQLLTQASGGSQAITIGGKPVTVQMVGGHKTVTFMPNANTTTTTSGTILSSLGKVLNQSNIDTVAATSSTTSGKYFSVGNRIVFHPGNVRKCR